MHTFESFAVDGKCEVCGKLSPVTKTASKFGNGDFCACESCFLKGSEPFKYLAAEVGKRGSFPDGFTKEERASIRRNILVLGIPEADFLLKVRGAV